MKAERTRAGCWRRLLSLLLDSALVYIPFQIIALVLFALTAGMVQFTSGLSATSCYRLAPPKDLAPCRQRT